MHFNFYQEIKSLLNHIALYEGAKNTKNELYKAKRHKS